MNLLPATVPTAPPMVGAWSLDSVQCCDALDLLRGLPAGSVDAIITDPPYFGVKDEAWDNQWDTADEFIAWIGSLCQQWKRVLKPNGSLYVFASPRMAARVEVEVGKWFNVLNNIRWVKDAGWHNRTEKEALRAYLQPWEAIIFAEQFNSDNWASGESNYWNALDDLRGFLYEPLRAYLDNERTKAGISFEEVRQIVGCAPGSGLPSHWFTRSQWALPTKDQYFKLRNGFNAKGGDYLRREYDYLRREYEDLRREYEDLRRPFNATPDAPYTDVWDFKTVAAYDGKHVCEKPLALMSHIIQISTRPGAIVLDCFAGSGATLDAARRLGRRFIGCDFDPHWAARAGQRVTLPYTVDLFSWLALQEVG